MFTEFVNFTMLYCTLGRTSISKLQLFLLMFLLYLCMEMYFYQVTVGTYGSGDEPVLHPPYFSQSYSFIFILFSVLPHAMHQFFLFRSFSLRKVHDLASQVSKQPYKLLLLLKISFIAYVANIIATIPGSMPMTPSVEHPPMETWSSPHKHLQHGLFLLFNYLVYYLPVLPISFP